MEFVQKLFVNNTPFLAMRSILGVGANLDNLCPYALIACAVWSSVIIKIILGGVFKGVSWAGSSLQPQPTAQEAAIPKIYLPFSFCDWFNSKY
jgi:hypothetical protein